MLDTLITSKTRLKLLLKFFLNSSSRAHLRNLETEFGESTNAIRLELNKFEEAGLLREVGTPENELMSKQVVGVVQASLQQLPEDLRSALTLREIEGLSYEEIAAVMNCPVGTVRSRIFRAREAVAENLRPLLETSKGTRW